MPAKRLRQTCGWSDAYIATSLAERPKGLSRTCFDSTTIDDAPQRSCKQLPSRTRSDDYSQPKTWRFDLSLFRLSGRAVGC